MIALLFAISIIFQISDAYVLLQVRRQDDNSSNVDALIHKVVPSDKFHKIARKMALKLNVNEDIANDDLSTEPENKKAEISLSLDENTDPNLMNLVNYAIKEFTKSGVPILRANNIDIKERPVKFRSGETSLLYEINSNSVLNALEDVLSSKIVRKYIDGLTRKAAVVFRAIQKSKE